MGENLISLRFRQSDAINCILHKPPPKQKRGRGTAPSPPSIPLGSGHLLLAANVVLGRCLKLILTVLAAKVICRPLISCLLFCRTVVDFHATHWVDSHS